MQHLSELGYAVVRSFEGCALRAYRDPVGVVTIGYGQTNSDASVLGFKVEMGKTITRQQAEDLLKASMERRYEGAVRTALPGGSQATFDAGCSFHFNTGAITRASWPKSWRAGQGAGSILSWNKGGGRVLPGLTRRRKRELAMINAGDYGPEGHARPIDLDAKHGHVPTHLDGQPGLLKTGDTGPEVAELNDKLIRMGYKVEASDTYTEQTKAAITSFQTAHPQLHTDGVTGPATRAAIDRAVALNWRTKQIGTSAGTGAAAGGADAAQSTGWHIPEGVYWAVGLVIVGLAVYTAWHYRDEIRGGVQSWWNKTRPPT